MVFGKHVNRYYLKYGWMLLLGCISLVVVDVAQLKVPEFYRMIVNGINSGVVEVNECMVPFDMDFLLDRICLPMLIIIGLMIVGRFLWRVCFYGSAIKLETDLRDRMFDHCKDLSQQYYQVNKVGDLMSLFTNDLETIQDSFGNGILVLCDASFLLFLAIYKMIRMNVTLTLLSCVPVVLIFVVGRILQATMVKKWEIRQEAFSGLSDFSQESFSGIAVVKAFAKEKLERAAFKRLNIQNENANVEYTKSSVKLDVLVMVAVQAIVGVIIGYGGYLVNQGTFTAGEMVEFIGYFTSIVWPVEGVAMLIQMTSKAQASLKRVGDLLDSKIDVFDDEEKIASYDYEKPFKAEIEFKNLDFKYPGSDLRILSDMSFKINAGERIGILGRTGAGKTTIVDLIARTYNVPDGKIFVNGVDINTIPIKELRNHIAYVPQDNFLFSDSIANNIAFAGDGEVNLEGVKEAAILSDVDSNIEEFPDKYETVLGERGVTVSGGQKQRISIARALMKNADILILDDSVSAVDTKTEKIIIDNLARTREGKTTLLIAHRISTIEKMDKILFIDDGRIVDFGTEEELLKRCPAFGEMVRLQLLEDLDKE